MFDHKTTTTTNIRIEWQSRLMSTLRVYINVLKLLINLFCDVKS